MGDRAKHIIFSRFFCMFPQAPVTLDSTLRKFFGVDHHRLHTSILFRQITDFTTLCSSLLGEFSVYDYIDIGGKISYSPCGISVCHNKIRDKE